MNQKDGDYCQLCLQKIESCDGICKSGVCEAKKPSTARERILARACGVSSRSTFGRSTGNDVSGVLESKNLFCESCRERPRI